ncbi:MAG: stage II sporulation protein R [Thermaerobacter sp.]|nr:stage II sporulation protein R [Thermaerobacter sp.]
MGFKSAIVGLLVIGMVSAMGPPRPAPPRGGVSSTPAHIIRLRVIANSDNPLDQAVKLEVRDAVLRILEPDLTRVRSASAAAQVIRRERTALAAAANQVLAGGHFAYRARVAFTRTNFPTKAYGSWVLPAGRYRALLVVLGRGQGHNWWCVLFPSLCFIDMSQSLAVPLSHLPEARRPPLSARRPPPAEWGHIRVSWGTPAWLARVFGRF